MVLMLVIMLALVGGLGFVKFKQVEAAIEQGKNFKIPSTAVTTVVVKKETWPSTLSVIGTAEAIQGVTVSADLPGTIDRIHFESGQWVKEGDILVELDTRQERSGKDQLWTLAGTGKARRHRAAGIRQCDGAAESNRGAGGRRQGSHRPKNDSRAVLRSSRNPASESGAVSGGGAGDRFVADDESDLRELRSAAAGDR
jgi:hypothetical protein